MNFPPTSGGKTCRYCGDASALGVCAKPGCQTQHTRDKAQEVQRRLLDGLRAKGATLASISSETLAEEATALGRSVEEIPVAILPRVDRPLVAVPQEDLDVLLTQLDEAIAEAFDSGMEGVAVDRDDIDQNEPELGDACCATCRGNCCKVGRATGAFLDATTIRHVRAQMPDASPSEIREIYTSRLPDVAVEGSCAFHGSMGCTLDRNTRADICNRASTFPAGSRIRRPRRRSVAGRRR